MHHHPVFTLGEFCYAVDLASFSSDSSGRSTINALWVEDDDGEITLCKGQLFAHEAPTFEEFKARINNRYGGHLMYRWDGFQMWGASPEFKKLVEAHQEMEPALIQLPNVPPKYLGWFRL